MTELIDAGHQVTGLARSDAAAARLEALGATPHRGSIEQTDRLRAGAEQADGVVHMAMGGDFSDLADRTRQEVAAIRALGEALVGTGKPLITTSGTLVMAAGRLSTERDAPDPSSIASFRIPGEQTCLGFADRGVRAIVLRLAPTVHGPRDNGFVAMLVQTARRTGVSAYVGDGSNRWPAVNRLDAATLYRLALSTHPQDGSCMASVRTPFLSGASPKRLASGSEFRPPLSPPTRRQSTSPIHSWRACSLPTRPPQAPTPDHCSAGHPRTLRCSRTWTLATTSHSTADDPPCRFRPRAWPHIFNEPSQPTAQEER